MPASIRLRTILASLLAIFDGIATYAHIAGGRAEEGNLLVAAMIELWGLASGLTIRTVGVVALLVGLGLLARRSDLARVGLGAVMAIFGLVAVYHLAGPSVPFLAVG